ncbi:SpoIIE family protein phosphatase [Maridesulfovibrio sp. FT414]|uniref:SpoIIE family protein phosphatase n=1 Tax=Maridesulfovibrio sp. FT414 TaxID=2979469 RepID=UPI003D803794
MWMGLNVPMKIRWKILIILLTFSLVPLFVLKTHGLNSLKTLGSDLQAQTRMTLLERATESLSRQAKGTAAMINLEDRLYRTTLKSVQGEAEIRLTDDDVAPMQSKPYITTPDGSEDPPALINNPAYKKRALMGKGMNRKEQHTMAAIQRGDLIDLPISLDHVSFWLPMGLSRKQAAQGISRLAPLLHAFQACWSTLGDLVLWQEVILENGLVVTYPAHDSFPRKYDARTHPWYTELKKSMEAGWALPFPDAATRTLCYRLSAPLTDHDGKFIGAASLVIPVGAALNSSLIVGNNGRTETMMVSSRLDEKEHRNSLLVVGKVGDDPLQDTVHTMPGRFWLAPPEPEWLTEDTPEFETLIEDVSKGDSGVLQMNFKGIPCLWTYSPINKSLSLLLITPVRDFTAEADEAEQYVRESIANQYEGTSWIAIFVIAAIALVAYFASKSFSRPISKLSEAVIKVGNGDWDVRADFHSKDELGELAANFNNMVPQLREHSATQQALSLADEAQQSLFPQGPPVVDGADIGARCVFSEKTGGDYYDFLGCRTCGPKTFAASIGDVSGHGISAALLMTSARAYIRALTGQGIALVDIISRVNRLITKDCSKTGHFMTAFTFICSIEEKKINWIRAGHDPALLYTPAEDTFEELLGGGMALGVDENFLYMENVTTIKSGQILILYTDGIWEAHSPAGEIFGKDKLRRIICENCHKPAQDMVDLLLNEVQNHRKGLPLEDDCTAIIVKFL